MSEPITLEAVEYKDGKLIFTAKPQTAIFRFIRAFKPGEYEIAAEKKKRRSNDANAYLWALVGKMSALLSVPNNDIYREEIRKYGFFEVHQFLASEEQFVTKWWSDKGIGWFTERADTKDDIVYLKLYAGSSKYDTKQMADLINGVILDAQSYGIETMPEEELQSLLNSWEGKR